MDSRIISGNTFGSNTIIVQGNFTSPEPLPTVNNAAHADGLRRGVLYHQESTVRDVEMQQDPTRKRREIEILRRLYKSPYEDRKNRNPDRTQGTCEWFVAHKLYQEWQESKRSTTLWVSADPGCGKSVLAKHLIDSLLLSTASRTTCYFFFKDDFEDQNNVVTALCCILHQLFMQKRVLLSEAILEQFEIYGEEATDSFEKLWGALLSVAEDGNAGEIVCLLDAIDECEDHGRSQLARALQTLYNTGRSFNLKFLLTSRPYVNIRHGFRPPDIPELAVIHLSGESDDEMVMISQEIDTFIQARVRVVGEKLKLRDDEQDILLRELMRVPNRTYLWVHLTLDLIEQDLDLDKNGIARITSHLPNTVEEAYERILSRSRNFEEAKKLLHIVVSAARPLTLNEMNLALTLRSQHQSYGDLDLKSEERFRENVRDLCGLFVAVINSRIYLLHQTAKEFLVQNNPANISKPININLKWKHSLRPQESHYILAEICIWHLLFAEFKAQSPDEKGMISQYSDNQVFLDYSAKHWTTHVRESHIEVKNSLSQSILKLCDGTSNHCLTWLRIYWRSTNTDFPRNFTALMIASYFGLTTAMKLLLILDSTDLNSRDSTYKRSALSWAAGNGYHIAVKLLIEDIRCRWEDIEILFKVGAQVDSVDRHGLTPLSYAVLNGHVAAAELLLEAGARVNTRDSIGGTPLSYAVCNGHEHMVNLLFKRGINIDLEEDMSVALLLSAAEKGHDGIVKLLLDKGRVDPNSKDKDGNTPLYLAVKNGHKPIIELLLGKPGDKVTITEEVVKAAAGNSGNGKEVMALLLDRRGDYITITEDIIKAAAGNSRNGKEVMALLLNQRGDHITITEEAVSIITAEFDEEVMASLLDRQGDHITITKEVVKAAALNSGNGNEVITLLLQQRGDKITITEEIISIVAAKFDKKVMALLLDRRRDQIIITEGIVKAAAGNWRNGKEVITLLLDRRGDYITITEEVISTIAAEFGEEVMALPLDRRGDEITIGTSSGARGLRSHRSQTSLLIEYFKGSRTGSSTSHKPSVRVRLTPSASKGEGNNHNIQVTETKTSRKGSLTRRIPLDDGTPSREHELLGADDGYSVGSYPSATEKSTVSRNPIDIEITQGQQPQQRQRRPAGPLIPNNERESSYPPGNGSKISAISIDSFLDGSPWRELGSGEHLEETLEYPKATKSKSKDRSSKISSDKPKEKRERKRRSKSRAGSISEPPPKEIYTSLQHHSSQSHNPEPPAPLYSAVNSSVLSSYLAPSHRSMDTRSISSGAINNPKLLETVEDAIRQLILPELSALKREQSKREA